MNQSLRVTLVVILIINKTFLAKLNHCSKLKEVKQILKVRIYDWNKEKILNTLNTLDTALAIAKFLRVFFTFTRILLLTFFRMWYVQLGYRGVKVLIQRKEVNFTLCTLGLIHYIKWQIVCPQRRKPFLNLFPKDERG